MTTAWEVVTYILWVGCLMGFMITGLIYFIEGGENDPKERRELARAVVACVVIACLAPFWPIWTPFLLGWGFLKVLKDADLPNTREDADPL